VLAATNVQSRHLFGWDVGNVVVQARHLDLVGVDELVVDLVCTREETDPHLVSSRWSLLRMTSRSR
jgi:hypothetical protein